jgi:multiple sugar transport system substrate-binding protein
MSQRISRLIIVGILLLAVPVLLVFAGGAQETEGPVTVTVWKGSWWADQAPVVEQAFAESHTNRVKIETYPFDGLIEKYITAIAGGQAPDVIAADNTMMPLLISRGMLQPISGVDRSDFSGAIWEASSADGKLYGIPFRADTSGVFYNKDMFDQAGLSYPDWNWTWDDLLSLAKALTIGTERYGFGISGSPAAGTDFEAEVLPLIWSNGGDVIRDGKVVLDEPGAIAGLQFWVDLVLKHQVSPKGSVNYDNKDYIEFFLSKRLAMMMGGSNVIPLLNQQAPDINWDFVQVPGVSKGFGYAYAIPVGAKNPEAAREYIEWFTEPENLSRLTIRMPARASATNDPPWNNPVYGKVMKATVNSKSPPLIPEWVEIRAMMIREMQRVLTGDTKSVEEAARIMTDQGNAIIR